MGKLRATLAVVATASCVVVAGATSAYRTEPDATNGCTNGVSDRINSRVVCIHVGGKCVAAHNAKYRRRGYTCANGRLRRVKPTAISIGDTSGAEGNSGATTLSVPVTLSAALPLECEPYGEIPGGIDFGKDVFPIDANGRMSVERKWSGSSTYGDVEWTSYHATISGIFDTPTTITGTYTETDELNYKGTHFRCASGEIRWSATRRS